MHSAARRRPTTIKPGGDPGRASVRESMKSGAKVFNANGGGENNEDGGEEGLKVYRRLRRHQSDGGGAADAKRRRNWKPPESPVQLRKSNSALPKITVDENSKRENLDDDEVREKALVVYNGDSLSEERGCNLEIEEERNSFDDKEIDLLIEKSNNVHEQTDIDQIYDAPDLSIPRKEIDFQTDSRNVHPDLTEPPPSSTVEVEEEAVYYEHTSTRQKRMQGFVDLIMWRDISKSALVFGFGTFFLLSTSYSKDINFSFISAISYLGLAYLAIIFLFKSIIRRGAVDVYEGDENYIVGEEEAVWVVNLLLPYINEFLLKIKALFSGDPATTMKLAALLFVLARCGNCITIWTMAKLVFFGVFTIPKVFSSYSLLLAKYGKFWLERFKDGWESCTHKKAVAAGVFTLIWNLSSTVARVWAVFMLVVGIRLYQQYMVLGEDYCNGEDEGLISSAGQQEQEDSRPDPGPKVGSTPLHKRHRIGPTVNQVGPQLSKFRKGL